MLRRQIENLLIDHNLNKVIDFLDYELDLSGNGWYLDSIQEEFETYQGTFEEIAFDICVYLNNTLDLSGNGWFDDDKEFLEHLKRKN